FMDPLHGGGRMNATTPRTLVELVSLRGKEWLLYPSMPLDCVLLRGTTADEDGNITLEDEPWENMAELDWRTARTAAMNCDEQKDDRSEHHHADQ
ncbi:hypothetical protein AB9E33_33920, partial [Rhizobium leguminosarum]